MGQSMDRLLNTFHFRSVHTACPSNTSFRLPPNKCEASSFVFYLLGALLADLEALPAPSDSSQSSLLGPPSSVEAPPPVPTKVFKLTLRAFQAPEPLSGSREHHPRSTQIFCSFHIGDVLDENFNGWQVSFDLFDMIIL